MKIRNLWQPPKVLCKHGLEIYKRIGPKLVRDGRLQDVDYELFVAFCANGGLAKGALEEIERDGVAISGGRGVLKQHPAFSIYRASMDYFIKLGDRFGLNPKARAEDLKHVKEKKKKDPSGKDPERFFTAVG